jgi:hypothetical protein
MTNVVVNDKVMFFSGSPLLEGWHSDYRNDGVFRNILMIFGAFYVFRNVVWSLFFNLVENSL